MDCSYCHSAVSEADEYIEGYCSVESCGQRTYHVECVQEYLKSGRADKKGCCNSSKMSAMKTRIESTPQEAMKRRMCPVGQDKVSLGAGVKPCTGMMESTTYHDRKKPKKKAEPPPLPVTSLNKIKEDSKKGVSQTAQSHHEVNAKDAQSRRMLDLHISHHNAGFMGSKDTVLDEKGSRGGKAPGKGRRTKLVLADNVQWSEEQIDVAIKQGSLSRDFRTRLCSSINGEEPCRLGAQCCNAHSLAELRVEAAVDMGYLSNDFKTSFCQAFLHSGHCENGVACMNAHSLGELRVLTAIQMNSLEPDFKTQRCQAYDDFKECPKGELCEYAHGSKQLRAEAAVQAGKLSNDDKTALCDMWCLGSPCTHGDQCFLAHGIADMRIQAAINAGKVKDVYKTSQCLKASCRRLHCHYYHDESDRLPAAGYKAQYCVAYKETGQCTYGKTCHFAHESSELLNVDASSNFVTRPIEDDETTSILSTETAKSKDDSGGNTRNDVRPGGAIVPLAVSNGKMPVAAPKAAVKQKRRKGLDLRLCKRFQETGNCTDPHCSLAHGAEDLKQRQMAARGEKKAPATIFNAATAPAPRVFSAEALDAIRQFKLSSCVEQLRAMGFTYENAAEAALAAAGDVILAADTLTSGNVNGDAGIPEMKLQKEIDDLCCIANTLNISTVEVEGAVMQHHGNHHKVMEELQAKEYDEPVHSHSQHPNSDMLSRMPPRAPAGPAISSATAADKDEDDVVAYEQQMWGKVKLPIWGPQDASPFAPADTVCTSPDHPDSSQQALQPASGDVSLQSADAESGWLEYRAEDFGHSAAPVHAAAQDDDAMLEAAIEASKAEMHSQHTAFQRLQPADGRSCSSLHQNGSTCSHEVTGHDSTEQPQPQTQNGGHRQWFPPAHAPLGKVASDANGTAQHSPHKAVNMEVAKDRTYDDVMAFLLGP